MDIYHSGNFGLISKLGFNRSKMGIPPTIATIRKPSTVMNSLREVILSILGSYPTMIEESSRSNLGIDLILFEKRDFKKPQKKIWNIETYPNQRGEYHHDTNGEIHVGNLTRCFPSEAL